MLSSLLTAITLNIDKINKEDEMEKVIAWLLLAAALLSIFLVVTPNSLYVG
jgi:hypothetical protein